MIIEFELQGSKMLHKGIFDTDGFWVKYEPEQRVHCPEDIEVIGYKLFSHLSFAFYHTDKTVVDLVYQRLISILRGTNSIDIEGVGYIRRLNK